jgi:hypothetical protein
MSIVNSPSRSVNLLLKFILSAIVFYFGYRFGSIQHQLEFNSHCQSQEITASSSASNACREKHERQSCLINKKASDTTFLHVNDDDSVLKKGIYFARIPYFYIRQVSL